MTSVLFPPVPRPGERIATPRRYLMCPPAHFAVDYAINPWMRPDDRRRRERSPSPSGTRCAAPTSTSATASTCSTPVPGLPDMVFAANGATVVDGTVLRRPLPPPAARGRGRRARRLVPPRRLRGSSSPEFVNEGEGDFLVAGDA